MATGTTSKKNIVDFLWDWSESNGNWAKLLISKVIGTETHLTTHDRKEIFDYYLESIKLKAGLPPISIKKPTYAPSSKKIEVLNLLNVKGVNKLAVDQNISFAENITVIYGNNGSGKTGYGRILKALGYSYDPHNKVLSDITKPTIGQTATIKYKVDGQETEFNWNGKDRNIDLENISVFNNNCVQISIADRGLLVSPVGFHLFNLVTTELAHLATIWQETIDKHPTALSWETSLHPGTIQENYITNLKGSSKLDKLTEISTFDETHLARLTANEAALKNLNKSLLEKELANSRLQLNELNVVTSKVNSAKEICSKANWEKVKSLNKQISDLEATANIGLAEIAEKNSIEFYNTSEFQTFIKAADDYIKKLGKEEYPSNEGDTCIYCKQELQTDEATNLLKSYRVLLNDNSQTLIKNAKDIKAQLLKQIAGIELPFSIHQDTFGTDDNGKVIQPQKIIDLNAKIADWKKHFLTDQPVLEFDLDYTEADLVFKNQKAIIEETIEKKQAILNNIEAKEKEISAIIFELMDRKLLSIKIDEIKKAIANKSIVSTLLSNKTSFSTTAISRKTTEARDELVQNEFNDIFNRELKSLRKSDIKIELSFGTSKGQSKIQQRISSNILSDILSEGEQKAIALAEFLTELQLDSSQAPVIFDDPVNSLDHKIIEDVSRRLISLSRNRQVIIFTHSVLLFNSILSQKKLTINKDIKKSFLDIRSEYGMTGLISESEADDDKVKKYITKINTLINNKPKDRMEKDVAAEGFGELRSAIEMLVEHNIFRGTVKRYQSNIALTNFIKVDGEMINKNKGKINELYDRCCRYTNAHSNPEEVVNEPSVAELQTDFNDFEVIYKEFPQN